MKVLWIKLLSWFAGKSGFILLEKNGIADAIKRDIPFIEWVKVVKTVDVYEGETIELTGNTKKVTDKIYENLLR